MKLSLTIAGFFLVLTTAGVMGLGQQTTCSCERSCHETVTCDGGCSALCGSLKPCLVSCGSDLIYGRITLKLGSKKGEEIASVLSARTHTKIEFTPYPRHARTRYDLEIKGDDVWNVLTFLDKFGNVKVGGADFSNLRRLRTEMRMKKKLSRARTVVGTYIRVLKASKARAADH